MKDIFRKQLDELIKKNVRLFNLQMKKKRDEPFLLSEEYHLSTGIENELFSWELQQTIGITENGKIHMMMFMHPIIVDDNNRREFIEFANAANLWLGSSLGRFWINQDNDFCYECHLPEFMIDHLDELEQQLFDKPFSHFRDILTPLIQLKDRKWTADKAIKYINELRTEGFIDNLEYGLC